MRRLIRHATAGAGISLLAAAVVFAGLSGSAAEQAADVAAPAPQAAATASPGATETARPTRGDLRPQLPAAEAARIAASRRSAALAEQHADIAARQAKLKKKRAAEAAERRRMIRKRGYEPGTTDPREIARQIMANKYGWGAGQFGCYDSLIKSESMWRVKATNPSSGAYGIPQSLPGSKMASAGSDWRTNPATQIIWGLGYVKAVYGTPCAAWGFKQGNNWY